MDEKIEEMANISTKEEMEARNKIGKEKSELKQALLHYATAEASGGIKSLIDCEGCAFYLYEMLGYRKESDTAREIYKELFEKQTEAYNKYVFKNDDYDDLEINVIINFSDSLSYEFEKFFKEKYGVDLGE